MKFYLMPDVWSNRCLGGQAGECMVRYACVCMFVSVCAFVSVN